MSEKKNITEPIKRYWYRELRKLYLNNRIHEYIIKPEKIIFVGKDGSDTLVFPRSRQVKKYFISLQDKDERSIKGISLSDVDKRFENAGLNPIEISIIGMDVSAVMLWHEVELAKNLFSEYKIYNLHEYGDVKRKFHSSTNGIYKDLHYKRNKTEVQ